MPTIEISYDKSSTRLQRVENDGKISARYSSRFTKNEDFVKASKELRCDSKLLMSAITTELSSIDLSPKKPPLSISLRSIYSSESIGYTSLELALTNITYPHPCPVISWNDIDQLCALDIDYHTIDYANRYDTQILESLARRIQPQPSFMWVTHGKGLRLIYRSTNLFSAAELATIAGIAYVNIDPLATFEIKRETRHPSYVWEGRKCGAIHQCTQTSELPVLQSLFNIGSIEQREIEEYLSTHNYVIGERYEHTQCPICPDNKANNRKPVVVREDGIYCHICGANGRTQGSRVAGWFPYAALFGRFIPSTISLCVRNRTHWDHAKYIWEEELGISESISRYAYTAAIKIIHGIDFDTDSIFQSGYDFIRFAGRWVTQRGEAYKGQIDAILSTLPCCDSRERIQRMSQSIDLTAYGYPHLTPIYGHRIHSHKLPTSDISTIPIVLQPSYLAGEIHERYRVKYLPDYDIESAWGVLEEVVPGVNRNLVYLLISAKGCHEADTSLPPMVYITGPTSSAKTSTIILAATIVGDTNGEVVWNNNVERVRQGIMEAKEEGSYVTFNEILKGINGDELRDRFDMILNITPSSHSHVLYRGSVKLGHVPIICFTDTRLPIEVKRDAQLARRLIHVHLTRQVDWTQSLITSKVGRVERIRTTDIRYADACNVIVSYVIDRFFTEATPFVSIAKELGFIPLSESEEALEGYQVLVDFYKLLCTYPDCDTGRGRGWKLVNRGIDTPLRTLWMEICDGLEGSDFGSSRRCSEVDWCKVLGKGKAIQFELRQRGDNVNMRFIDRETAKTYRVNQEI